MNNDAFAAALAEIEEGRLDKGAWARAFAESGGDESKAKALYIKARAESINDSPAWPGTRPQVENTSKEHVASGSGHDVSANRLNEFYEAVIGKKNLDYYLDKFHAFDNKESGLHVSWNWAAFFGGGAWALYRKMYGWFVTSWIVVTVVTVFAKVPNAQIHQVLAVVCGVLWLGFSIFANSLYHRKVKSQIAPAQKSNSDASRVREYLGNKGGVHVWVPIVFAGIPVLGLVAAVALPTYQDYTKRQAVAASPVQAPAPGVDRDKFVIAPPTTQSQVNEFLDGAPKPVLVQSPQVGLVNQTSEPNIGKVESPRQTGAPLPEPNEYGAPEQKITRSVYENRVAVIRAKMRSGEYSFTNTVLRHQTPQQLTRLDNGISEAIEKAQTSWRTDGVMYLHISNSSSFRFDAVGLSFQAGECGGSAKVERFYAILSNPIAPSGNSVVSFKPIFDLGQGNFCLVVESLWG